MDNLCHTLVGAAIGESGLKGRTRFGNPALMIAANLPDLDVLVFATNTPAASFRRGWTHGVLAQALLPVALAAMLLAWDRWRPRRDIAGPPARAGMLIAISATSACCRTCAGLPEQLRRPAADAVLPAGSTGTPSSSSTSGCG